MRPSPLVAILALGCAGATIPMPPSSTPASTSSPRDADALVSVATGCWMGSSFGEASDALPRDRCTDVLLRAWGTADEVHRVRLQTLEPDEIGALRARLQDFGASRSLVAAFDRIARARRETVLARRSAVTDALDSTDTSSVPSNGVLALFAANLGDATLEAELRTIALMSVLERMDAVRDMPRAIQTEAVAGFFRAFYGITRPTGPSAMEWLAYLEAITAAMGHVPPPGDLDEREAWAWGVVRSSLGEDLAGSADSLPESDLRRAAMGTAARIGATRSLRAPIHDAAADAHAIVMHAATCWLDTRSESRACTTLARILYEDPVAVFEAKEPLRWAEPAALEALERAVTLAGGSSVDRDVALLRATGSAAREATRVRWAAGALRVDHEQPVCLRALDESAKLLAVIHTRDASIEARAIGWAFAAERLWTARGLSEDLEMHVAAPILSTLTGDAKPVSFERTARVTGRPIVLRHVEDFDIGDAHAALARGSVGEAIADRLRVLSLATPLSDVTRSVVLRLDIEYRAALAHYEP